MSQSTSLKRERPLSPHLSVYRWHISNTLSILHRISGFGLSLGTLVLAAWIWGAAYSPDLESNVVTFFGTIIGKIFLFGWTLAYFYHLSNGIRHLFWDIGKGFELPDMTASGYAVLLSTVSLTAMVWYVII